MRSSLVCVLLVLLATAAGAAPETVTFFDFTQGTQGWIPAHSVDNFEGTSEGLAFDCVGDDPYVTGPPVENMPLGNRVLLTVRMKSDHDGTAQIFYGPQFLGDHVDINVIADGEWHDYEALLPVQLPGTRLRIDPANMARHVVVAWIKGLEMKPLMRSKFVRPQPVEIGQDGPRVTSGNVTIAHDGKTWGGFAVVVDGETMAASHGQSRIGVAIDGEPTYLDLQDAVFSWAMEGGSLKTAVKAKDTGGAQWTLSRTFVPAPDADTVDVTTTVTVDANRDLFHLPMVTLFAGMGTFGTEKTQAVLPGVEYLANEPSSSEADVRGEKANRRIVDDYRLCSTMMSVVANDRYVAMAWDRADHPAPVFDSPDRVFQSGGHLMGLWYPAVGECRIESEFDIYRTFPMAANTPISLTARIFGGSGATINPAMQHYIKLKGGLLPIPEYKGGLQAAINLLAHGWLDSALQEDGTWRHAVWGETFKPAVAADAPGYMLWLAEFTEDAALAERLRKGAERGLERVRATNGWNGRCSHVVRPFVPLIFGDLESNIEGRVRGAQQSLGAFDPQGLVRYRPRPGGPDYGSTHWENHANGLSANQLAPAMEAAALSGDESLAAQALAVLDKQLAIYRDTVPRGAQTWEMPLHTPDILASAHVLRCCDLAYMLTGDPKYIEAGRYWAETGLSMVYLDPPTEGPTGLYATTAVLGATAWAAPYWIGQPVQWCGLVYRSALQDFAKSDVARGAFWSQVARGITRSGLQQTFPLDDESRQGLLPDFFHLKPQKSDGPAISPGTVQANLAEAYGVTPIYDARRLGDSGMIVHVPGGIGRTEVDDKTITIPIAGWYPGNYWVRIVGVPEAPAEATLSDGEVLALDYGSDRKALNIMVKGEGTLVITR